MITVIGLGFVGLTTGLGFSHKGFKVYGVDVWEPKLNAIKKGEVPFYEPHLEEALKKHLGNNFIPTNNLKEALENSEIVFYCVGTPMGDTGAADLSQLLGAIESTLKLIDKKSFKVLVVKSTIPPSTTKEKIKPFIEKMGFKTGTDVGLANNPEFLREGYAWDDFVNPDRVVVGTEDEKSLGLLKKIYEPFGKPIHSVSHNSGEYIKYLSNTLLSTLISFANEQSMIAHTLGDINISQAFKILHQDKRWHGSPAGMSSYVYPGCGFGGYCLPKDTNALVALAGQKGYDAGMLKNALHINDEIKDFHVGRIAQSVAKDEPIGVLGLSFKPNSDDVRDSPAMHIISRLVAKGYTNILGYDPIANTLFDNLYKLPVKYMSSMEDVVANSKCLLILTGWSEFKEKKELLNGKTVFDLRYIL